MDFGQAKGPTILGTPNPLFPLIFPIGDGGKGWEPTALIQNLGGCRTVLNNQPISEKITDFADTAFPSKAITMIVAWYLEC